MSHPFQGAELERRLDACFHERDAHALGHAEFRHALSDEALHRAARDELARLNELNAMCNGNLHLRCFISATHHKILQRVLDV